MHTLILLATETPAPEPSLRPGLSEEQVTPGLLGFIITFAIVVVMFFLIRDMVKRVRRVRYRTQVDAAREGGSHAAEFMGIPIMSEADTRAAAYTYDDEEQPPTATPPRS